MDESPEMTREKKYVWSRLTTSSKQAFGWAYAASLLRDKLAESERGPTGLEWVKRGILEQAKKRGSPLIAVITSEDLLGGILRSHPGASEPEQLLRHIGLSASDLDEAIRNDTLARPTFPNEPFELRKLPNLSTNVQRILEAALELAERHNPEANKLVRLRELFGGILFTEESQAYKVLARTLKKVVSLVDIRETYPEFLEGDSPRKYSEFLPEWKEVTTLDIHPRAVSDMPSETDVLGVSPLVEGLYALLNDRDTKLPLAIAVTAPWGGGKSSVMLQLKKKLQTPPSGNNTRPRRSWYTIRFDAWKYEKSERLWAAMAKAIYEQPQKHMKLLERVWFRFRLEWRRIGAWSFLFKVLGPAFTLAMLSLAVLAKYGTNFPSFLNHVRAGIIGGTGGLFGSALYFFGVASHPFKRSLQAYTKRPKYEEQLGFTAEADQDISHLIEVLTKSENRALAIFVDDLDRCSSRHVVEVVEAINQIFNSSEGRPCVFILGMDREVVAASIDVANKEMVEQLRKRKNPLWEDYGLRFLSKIVQISVAIPPPNSQAMKRLLRLLTGSEIPVEDELDLPWRELVEERVESFIQQLRQEEPVNPIEVRRIRTSIETTEGGLDDDHRSALDEAERRVRAELFTSDSEDVRQAEFEVLKSLDKNPRQVKRFDNAFRLQLYVANLTPESALEFNRDQLVALGKWVALRLRWPQLADDLDREPKLLGALEEYANNGGKKTTLVKSLFNSHERWFSEDALLEVFEEEYLPKRIASLPFDSFLGVA